MSSESILGLPTDLLSFLCDHLHTKHIFNLYLCGNNLLNHKLRSGGALKFLFNCSHSLLLPAIPTIQKFHCLQHLTIISFFNKISSRSNALCTFYQASLELICLTHLKLHIRQTEHMAISSFPPKLNLLDIQSHIKHQPLPKLSFECNFPSSFSHLKIQGFHIRQFDLNDGLKSLELEDGTATSFFSSSLSFPEGLSILKWRADYVLDGSIPDLHHSLPSGLTHLDLAIDNFTDSTIHLLPRSLTFLGLLANTTLTDAAIPLLPTGLKSLELIPNNQLTDAAIPLLPSGLTYLELPCNSILTNECIPLLPPELLHLDLTSAPLTDEAIAALPRGLTYLNLCANEELTDLSIPFLPRGLTSLSLDFNNKLTNACIPAMPRELTHLNLSFNRNLSNECVPSLPQSLKYLDFSVAHLTDDAIEMLPAGLELLRIGENCPLTDKAIIKMPRGLTHLDLRYVYDLTDACAHSFPRGLTYLDISTTYMTEACLSRLPKTIQTLRCGFE